MPDHSTCRSCGADILWVVTEAGRKMPLDPQSCLDGNIALGPPAAGLASADPSIATVLTNEAMERCRALGVPLYKPHFATCPNATKHRKKK